MEWFLRVAESQPPYAVVRRLPKGDPTGPRTGTASSPTRPPRRLANSSAGCAPSTPPVSSAGTTNARTSRGGSTWRSGVRARRRWRQRSRRRRSLFAFTENSRWRLLTPRRDELSHDDSELASQRHRPTHRMAHGVSDRRRDTSHRARPVRSNSASDGRLGHDAPACTDDNSRGEPERHQIAKNSAPSSPRR